MLFYIFFLLIILYLCGPVQIKMPVVVNVINKKKNGYIIAIIFIILVSSIRKGIGYDWYNYEEIIRWYGLKGEILSRYEFFDNYIFYFGGILKSPFISFAIFAIIIYGIIGYSISVYSENRFESLVIYLALFYLSSLSTIRQAAAVAIIFVGYRFIYEKKLLKYIVIVLIAMGFHSYAFVGIIIYPIYHMSASVFVFFVASIVVACKWLLPIIILDVVPSGTYYISSFANSSGNVQKIIYLLFFLYCFGLYFLARKQEIKNDSYYKEINALLKICFIGVLMPFVLGGHTGGRVAEYFLIFYSLVVPLCNKYLKWRIRAFIICVCAVCFLGYLYVSVKSGNAYIPYETYFGR